MSALGPKRKSKLTRRRRSPALVAFAVVVELMPPKGPGSQTPQ